jgi:UDP-N-acetylmuramoylalanine-D-glutamate ligase
MDGSSYFRGKKITVMGLGLLGRGLGDVRYLASSGADLIVTDLKTKEQPTFLASTGSRTSEIAISY